MKNDSQPPITLPGGGSLTLPSMSGSTHPTPQTTATTTQQDSNWKPFEHGVSTSSDIWLVAAILALIVWVIIAMAIRAFFSGCTADVVHERTNEASIWRSIVVMLAFFGLLAVGLAMTGVKLW